MEKIKKHLSKILILICGILLATLTKVKADSGFGGGYGGSSGGSYSGSSSSSGGSFTLEPKHYTYLAITFGYVVLCVFIHGLIFVNEKEQKPIWQEKLFCFIAYVIGNIIIVLSNDIEIIVMFCLFALAILGYFWEKLDVKKKLNPNRLSSEKIQEKLGKSFNENIFCKKVFNIYKDVQIAWMNNTLEDVRNVLTDEMFNMYKMQLMTLTTKQQKNMMEEITFKKAYIMDIRQDDDKDEIDVCLNVTCRDYIIDTTDNSVLRGSKNNIIEYVYKLSFIRTREADELNKCPSCGSELGNQISSKCPHCGNIIVSESSNFIMTEKKVLYQTSRRG